MPFHTKKQLAATTALAMDIVEGQWTVKVRDAGPGEPEPGEADPGLWTGILPIISAYGHPRDVGQRAGRHAGLAVGAQASCGTRGGRSSEPFSRAPSGRR